MKKITSILLVLTVTIMVSAQTGIPRAQAMFIYNFSRLIEWPDSYKSGPFIIGVFGASATLNELDSYTNNKSVGSQPIQVRKFNSPAEIANCHILFIPFNKTKEIAGINQALGSKSTLIITEKSGAISDGAAINFLIVGDKLKFEIKPSNATDRRIKMSSKLSEMAFKTY